MTAAFDDPRIREGMRRQFALFEERKRAGAHRIGWKVGFGAPAAMQKLNITAPLIGFLTDKAVLPDGATVSLTGWVKPAAEPEIAIEMGRDLSAGAGDRDVVQAVVALGPAIELADVDGPMDDVESILAGDIFQRHVVFGPRRTIKLPDGLSGLTGKVTRSGQSVSVPADLESNTGRLVEITRQVADTLAAFGETLRAGDVIIAGSVTPPQFLGPEDHSLRWTLHPIGSVGLTFSH